MLVLERFAEKSKSYISIDKIWYAFLIDDDVLVSFMTARKWGIHVYYIQYTGLLMRKLTICLCKNKDADQLRGNCEADKRICFLLHG